MVKRLAVWALALAISPLAFAQDDAKAKEAEAEAKIKEFKAAIGKPKATESDICDAINKLGETQHKKIKEELKKMLGKSKDITGAAAEQLGKYEKDADAAEALMGQAAAQRDAKTAAACIRHAADTKVKGIAGKLIALYSHKDLDVASEAIDASGRIKSKDCVTPLIKLVKDLEAVKENNQTGAGQPNMPGPGGNMPAQNTQQDERVQRKKTLVPAALSALKAITGEKWTTGVDWDRWWNKTKDKFKEPD